MNNFFKYFNEKTKIATKKFSPKLTKNPELKLNSPEAKFRRNFVIFLGWKDFLGPL
jgi:hypothetical protein